MLRFIEARELADEVRRLFEELARARPHICHGECAPLVDLVETAEALEIRMDLPGVSRDAMKVLFKNGTLLIAGEKPAPPPPDAHTTFHLVERAFGRFARAIRIGMAVDAAKARATFRAGELHVVVPKIPDRRGREIEVPVES